MYGFWYDYIKPKYQDSKTMLHGYQQLSVLNSVGLVAS